ncbi:lysostaphin resistance A-like protein [Geodermatophilus sp. SYSU D00742]
MSATHPRRPAAASPGGLRDRVARRPLTAFLVLLCGLGWPLMSVPALTAHGVLPGGPLPQEPFALGTTLVVMLPAALWVTAVADGSGAVRALLRRAVRWRFGVGWWAAVLLGLPVLTLAVGAAVGADLETGDLPATLGRGVLSVLTAVLLVHLWEETVWAGFFQGRLEQRYGFLPAAALTAVPFAGVHLPLSFVGDVAPGRLALSIGGLFVLGALLRPLVGATVRGAGGSLLAAGLVHATFNAANNQGNVADDLLRGGRPSLYAVVAAVLFTAGALLALRSRR